MSGYMQRGETKRAKWDDYPTPEPAVRVLREFLLSKRAHVDIGPSGSWLEPAAGSGAIIRVLRDCDEFGEGYWTAIEVNGEYEDALEDVAENVIIADALDITWPDGAIMSNPPFNLLDVFWPRVSEHRAQHACWCAVFTPCAWWHAERRAEYVRPDYLLALGWRPPFRKKTGPAHKGSQDFVWAILAPVPQLHTQWIRVEKP